MRSAIRRASSNWMAEALGGCLQPQALDHQAEPLAVLGQVDALRAGADDRHALRLQRPGQVQRRLAAELDDHSQRA